MYCTRHMSRVKARDYYVGHPSSSTDLSSDLSGLVFSTSSSLCPHDLGPTKLVSIWNFLFCFFLKTKMKCFLPQKADSNHQLFPFCVLWHRVPSFYPSYIHMSFSSDFYLFKLSELSYPQVLHVLLGACSILSYSVFKFSVLIGCLY